MVKMLRVTHILAQCAEEEEVYELNDSGFYMEFFWLGGIILSIQIEATTIHTPRNKITCTGSLSAL